MGKHSFRLIIAALAALLSLSSCSGDADQSADVSGHVGKVSDGLEIKFNSRDFLFPGFNEPRTFDFVLNGYVTEDTRLEIYNYGFGDAVLTRKDLVNCSLTLSPGMDSCQVRIFASNGHDLAFQTVTFSDIYFSASKECEVEVSSFGGETALDWLSSDEFSIRTDPSAPWLKVSDTGKLSAEPAGELDRSARVTVSSASLKGTVVYVVIQQGIPAAPQPDTDYKQKFDYYFSIAGGHTVSKKTPMGKVFNDRPAATEAQKAWLANPENEPDTKLDAAPNATLKPAKTTLYPSGHPTPADVNQGSANDCAALSMLTDLAYQCPDYIEHIITDNGNGTFTVRMFDALANPIDVCVKSTYFTSTAGNIVQVTGKNKTACWSTVLEKALFKYDSCFNVNRIEWTGPVPIVAMLTGHGECFHFGPGKIDGKTMQDVVDVMLQNHMLLMVMFQQKVNFGTVQTVTGHAYSGMYTSSPTAWFAVRNPWGFNNNVSSTPGEGVMNIEHDEVQKLIELRIMFPGDADNYAKQDIGPYR